MLLAVAKHPPQCIFNERSVLAAKKAANPVRGCLEDAIWASKGCFCNAEAKHTDN